MLTHSSELFAPGKSCQQPKENVAVLYAGIGRLKLENYFKKTVITSQEAKRSWIDPTHPLPIVRQCGIIGLRSSSYYQQPRQEETEANPLLMRQIDCVYTATPFFGVPLITHALHERGMQARHERVARLMCLMGIAASAPGPHTSKAHPADPYVLQGRKLMRPDEVCCADITNIAMNPGYQYLMAVLDWYSRYVSA